MARLSHLATLLAFVSLSLAASTPHFAPHGIPLPPPPPSPPVSARTGAELPSYDTIYIFDQLIDHDNPDLGTFEMRFWASWEFWEPGGPIVFMNAGEVNAETYGPRYINNSTVNGLIAQATHGAAVVIEHRFYGESNPYPNLNEDSLRLLTLDQAIQDNVYFAQNVVLPFDGGDAVGPDQAPWIIVGGSYPGALAAWTQQAAPDVFFAGLASSAVVEVQVDFWEYFLPIRENMPANCSADVQAVIAHVDSVLTGSDESAKNQLKATFGRRSFDDVDFAGSFRWDIWNWQSQNVWTHSDGLYGTFDAFCDGLEVRDDGSVATESGWGLDHALEAWAAYDTAQIDNVAKRQDEPVDDANRSWTWQVCTEMGFQQVGPPANSSEPAIVSHLVTPETELVGCSSTFPQTNPRPDVGPVLARGGWDMKVDRLVWTNGRFDPWREATPSAEAHNLTNPDDPRMPIILMDGGWHASDLLSKGAIDPSVAAAHQRTIERMVAWLPEFTPTS